MLMSQLVTEPGCVSGRWGVALAACLAMLAAWAERQGLELAADCHLARTHQAGNIAIINLYIHVDKFVHIDTILCNIKIKLFNLNFERLLFLFRNAIYCNLFE